MQFPSTEASWEILEQDHCSITLKGRWGHWDLEQIWYLKFLDNNTVEWTIENASDIGKNVEFMEIQIMGSSQYDRYITPDKLGTIPAISPGSCIFESLLMRTFPRRFMGFYCGKDSGYDRQGILVDFRGCPDEGASQIKNGSAFFNGCVLSRTFPTHTVSRITVQIKKTNNHQMIDFFNKNRDKINLDFGSGSLFFNWKTFHLYDNTTKITKGNGFFSYPAEHVQQSIDIEWEVLKTGSEISIRGTDRRHPLVYCWSFQSKNDVLFWSLTLEYLGGLSSFDIFVGIEFADGITPTDRLLFTSEYPKSIDNGIYRFLVPEEIKRKLDHPVKMKINHGTLAWKEAK